MYHLFNHLQLNPGDKLKYNRQNPQLELLKPYLNPVSNRLGAHPLMSLMSDMLKMRLLHRSPNWKNKWLSQSWLERRRPMSKSQGQIRGKENNGVMVKYHKSNLRALMQIGKAMRRVSHRWPKGNVVIVIISNFHQVQKLLKRNL